jgi:stress response protein YsnF
MINKEKFYIPKNIVESYDGSIVLFNISKEEANNKFMRDLPPLSDEYSSSYRNADVEEEDKANVLQETDTHVPLIEERLNISKEESTEEATVTKEPVIETKIVEIPVTHEEITIEERPSTDRKYTSISSENPVESRTEIKIH